MSEYINKVDLYNEIAKLEELARNRYLDTPSNSPGIVRYQWQLTERTNLKHLIVDFPVADVAEVRHGKWITWEKADNFVPSPDRYECSVCHDAAQILVNGFDLLSDYCPNCGAKMDLED